MAECRLVLQDVLAKNEVLFCQLQRFFCRLRPSACLQYPRIACHSENVCAVLLLKMPEDHGLVNRQRTFVVAAHRHPQRRLVSALLRQVQDDERIAFLDSLLHPCLIDVRRLRIRFRKFLANQLAASRHRRDEIPQFAGMRPPRSDCARPQAAALRRQAAILLRHMPPPSFPASCSRAKRECCAVPLAALHPPQPPLRFRTLPNIGPTLQSRSTPLFLLARLKRFVCFTLISLEK